MLDKLVFCDGYAATVDEPPPEGVLVGAQGDLPPSVYIQAQSTGAGRDRSPGSAATAAGPGQLGHHARFRAGRRAKSRYGLRIMSRAQEQHRRTGPADGPCGPWGATWSAHIASFGDFAGRRERGRSYLSEGAVLELQVEPGRLSARVQGSRTYHPRIVVQPLSPAMRAGFRELTCAGSCSLRDLLRAARTTPQCGLLPDLGQLSSVCNCPDRTRPCKHIFAALYAVGRRLDDEPELLLALRGVELDDLRPEPPRRPRRSSRPASPRTPTRPPPALRAPRVAAPRRAPAKTVRVTSRQVRRAELRALGVPARTIDGWISQGILKRTAERGVYRRTAAVERRLAARGVTGA